MLEITGLTAGYGDLVAVDGVSLKVGESEFVGILGANNAGKSTLANAISGVVTVRSGSVRVGGKEITDLPPHERVNLGLVQVPEGRRLFPEMSVFENLWLGGYTRRAKANRHKSLKRVHQLFPILADRAQQPVGQLSGGQQQMVAVGRALMAEPALLVLDEPSLGLAPLVCRQLFDVLSELSQEGLTILLIEQNMSLSITYITRAYVLENGRLVYEGTRDELSRSDEARQAYFGMSNTVDGEVR